MSKLIDEAYTELAAFRRITQPTGVQVIEQLQAYEQALEHIASLPEPLPKIIAQRTLDKYTDRE